MSQAPNAGSKRVIFLDRDGTLNVDCGYVHRREEWEFTGRAPESVRLFSDVGFRIAVVTNQSGIAAGFYSDADTDLLHAFMCRELTRFGVCIDAVVYCPHDREGGCDCRKPNTGMARQVAQQLEAPIDYAASWTIGDKLSDLEFGVALGTHTALIRSRYWSAADLAIQPDLIVDSLYDAARAIVTQNA